MGRLVVIEGLDGAGKRTLAEGLATELARRGRSTTRLAFPRYEQDVHAALVAEALRGGHGDLGDSVHGMAVLYALDRRGAVESLNTALAAHDVVLLDRYVASNAAYGAARLHEDAGGSFVAWVRGLEIDRFGLPRPDLHLLLQVAPEVAAGRAEHRERTETDRERDRFESDDSLQQRCRRVYAQLAAEQWWSPWLVVDGGAEVGGLGGADAARTDLGALTDAVLGV
ncbi:dTMP kinase [Allosaccharopolyspora coralli]|uniref:Thymidylate kinase n=1 Tax=Allosaccharopolyspora coralli TaxID=2665642 RepID=A0A5Q3Q9Q0_9PSEU|nr:dTMP kinase [Allosaccharopolyspora coralli]QGK71288.1 dTMP kinase [Allosaccharopolyspora coralli]